LISKKYAIYIVGSPGVGKSTLMKSLIANLTFSEKVSLEGTFYGHEFDNGVYLGLFRDEYPGTDGLVLTCAPDAEKYVSSTEAPILIGEGSKFTYARFFQSMTVNRTLIIIKLIASRQELEARRKQRNSNQNPSWLKATDTRIFKALNNVNNVQVLTLDTNKLSPAMVSKMVIRKLPDDVKSLLNVQ
jgi:GTPase SAR1 family protein